MKLADLAKVLETIAPLELSADWDNNGLLAGDPVGEVGRVLLTIDLTDTVLAEAEKFAADLAICYHPPLFRPLRRVVAGGGPGGRVYRAVRGGLALYAMHTTLDAAAGGTNDVLAEVLGLADARPLAPHAPTGEGQYKLVTFVPADAADRVAEALFAAGAGRIGDYERCSFRVAGTGTFFGGAGTSPAVGEAGRPERVEEVRLETIVPAGRSAAVVAALRAAHPYEEVAFDLYRLAAVDERVGLGRVGPVAEPAPLEEMVARIKRGLGVDAIWLAAPAGETNPLIDAAACCAGSCGDLVGAAIDAGAQLYLTGELRHHDALAAAEAGMAVAMVRHSVSERLVLGRLAKRIAAAAPTLELRTSQADADPFRWA